MIAGAVVPPAAHNVVSLDGIVGADGCEEEIGGVSVVNLLTKVPRERWDGILKL